MDTRRQSRVTAGLTLIVVGLVLYFIPGVEGFADTAVFAVLGAIFLVGYFWRRIYGLLVPAGILLGLSVGSSVDEVTTGSVDWTLVGLGCGFFLIWGLDRLDRDRSMRWPLVSGIILILFAFPVTERLVQLLVAAWPLLLVVIGAVIVATAVFRSPGSSSAAVSSVSVRDEGAAERAGE